MSVIATALRHMLAAGMDHESIVAAVEAMETAIPSAPTRSKGAERQARYAERKRQKTSENVTCRQEPSVIVIQASENVSGDDEHPSPLVPPSLSPRPPIPPPYNPPSPETPSAEVLDFFGGCPPEPPAAKTARPVKTFAMPPDWMPSHDNRTYAAQNGLTDEETDRAAIDFRDHFADKPSEKRPGWDRSWQRWVRTACDRKRERTARMAGGAYPRGGGRGPVDIGGIIIRRRAERGE